MRFFPYKIARARPLVTVKQGFTQKFNNTSKRNNGKITRDAITIKQFELTENDQPETSLLAEGDPLIIYVKPVKTKTA